MFPAGFPWFAYGFTMGSPCFPCDHQMVSNSLPMVYLQCVNAFAMVFSWLPFASVWFLYDPFLYRMMSDVYRICLLIWFPYGFAMASSWPSGGSQWGASGFRMVSSWVSYVLLCILVLYDLCMFPKGFPWLPCGLVWPRYVVPMATRWFLMVGRWAPHQFVKVLLWSPF